MSEKSVLLLTRIPGISDNFIKHEKGFKTTVALSDPSKAGDFDIVVIDPPLFTPEIGKSLFSEHSKVKWIHSTYAGVDGLIKQCSNPELPEYRPLLTKTGFYLKYPMFEYVLQHLLNHENEYQAVLDFSASEEKDWKKTCFRIISKFRPKHELKIGMLGFGNIGKYIAESLGRTFGIKDISVFRRTEKEEDHPVYKTYKYYSDIRKFLESNDFDYIISVLPSTPSTIGLLTFDLLESCLVKKNHTVFMNLGRGDLIKTEDIVKLLRENVLGKAILDVFEKEPLEKDSKLWEFYPQKVILTPHCGGWSSPKESFIEFQNLFRKYQKGEELDYQVSWKRGY